ncbi:MAG: ATP-binding protein [Janthinobacterium lividum]
MKSIHRGLLGWLILGLMATSIVAGVAIFTTARAESGELFDYELRMVALSLPDAMEAVDAAEQPTRDYGGIADDRIVIETWNRQGTRLYRALSAPELTLPQSDGFSSMTLQGVRWRAFRIVKRDRLIVVAQPYSIRDDLGFRLAWRTLWPFGLLVPATIIIVLLVVARGLSPIARLSQLLMDRSVRALSPLSLAGIPEEIQPLVAALNALLERLATAAHTQQTFIADAAHELRTPLTALKLQLQAATREGLREGDAEILERLESRVNRMIHLLRQLLSMAREDASDAVPLTAVSLRRIAETAVADLSLLAEAGGVDLGLVTRQLDDADSCRVQGDAAGLAALLGNLIDNAIRHTDTGGRIDVILHRGQIGFNVDVVDSGPGLPDHELERVFDRFYRGETARGAGSGLGLAIAASIAARHGARLVLANRDAAVGPGLIASVVGLSADASSGSVSA